MFYKMIENKCTQWYESEPCGSSILSLVQDCNIDYDVTLRGEKFIDAVIDHLGERGFLIDHAGNLIATG